MSYIRAEQLEEVLDDVRAKHGPRWVWVLERWYGLRGAPKMTYSAMGEELGVTAQRVFQIRKKATDAAVRLLRMRGGAEVV